MLLSRAIAKKPELLVLDEPVRGVDNAGEEALYSLIETIAKNPIVESSYFTRSAP